MPDFYRMRDEERSEYRHDEALVGSLDNPRGGRQFSLNSLRPKGLGVRFNHHVLGRKEKS
jgi:hypothetical protein